MVWRAAIYRDQERIGSTHVRRGRRGHRRAYAMLRIIFQTGGAAPDRLPLTRVLQHFGVVSREIGRRRRTASSERRAHRQGSAASFHRHRGMLSSVRGAGQSRYSPTSALYDSKSLDEGALTVPCQGTGSGMVRPDLAPAAADPDGPIRDSTQTRTR